MFYDNACKEPVADLYAATSNEDLLAYEKKELDIFKQLGFSREAKGTPEQ